ncbi:hypothetical protein EI77_03590 [Prosthecobacter fusiformis]|uniref:Uncharacterized protein n=1 Tax=Prosthecobacter fusiformis TaxID=48464 RepID=A0A4R7RP20_9BACT|nr:hypothetical protein [Prosthecobacter fusiformis]TDU66495.1 hypothetical protein EI77_03590 [Prosthecobacter fusiformis]
MENTKKTTSLLESFKEAYPKLRKTLIYTLIVALTTSALIEDPKYKATVLSILGITLLFLLFDIYNTLTTRLEKIEECVAAPAPPHFDDFPAAYDHLYKAIEDALVERPSIKIQFLTVSGSYSWPFLEDAIRRLDKRFGPTKALDITFCLIQPDSFDTWKLFNWKDKSQVTIAHIEEFKHRAIYLPRIESGKLSISTILFDNIPHWHGVLINETILFMGRTEWEFPADEQDGAPNLLVGQIEYRKFHKSDRFGGDQRIDRFKNWVKRYEMRSKELEQLKAEQTETSSLQSGNS